MNIQIANPPPDVDAIQTYDYRSINEVNERIKSHGWVLLGILIEREVDSKGNFTDHPEYILGHRRDF
jgi:hypothetical protein